MTAIQHLACAQSKSDVVFPLERPASLESHARPPGAG
jgi:hypothetical protein